MKGLAIIPSIMAKKYKGKPATRKRKMDEIPTVFPTSSNAGIIIKDSDEKDKIVKIQRPDKEWKESFKQFCNQYHRDLPNVSSITYEVDNWE